MQILGQFYPAAEQFFVYFGGVFAKVLSATSTRLLVNVPLNAQSSQVTVSATNGSVTSSAVFVVSSNAIVRFQPPSGMAASNFDIANNYGDGVLISNTAADYSIPVRVGSPTMTFALVPGQGSNLFFCAVSFDARSVILLNAASTAQTLVFQNPNLFTSDPDLAPAVMGLIQTNTAVQSFAQTLATDMAQSATPFQDAIVTNAYENAVLSVLTNNSLAGLASSVALMNPSAPVTQPVAMDVNSSAPLIYQIEYPGTRFLEPTASGLNLTVGVEDFYYNPVDWMIVYQDIDVDAAFPGGRSDFNQITQNWETTPRVYPTKGVLYAERSVEANLLSSRLNVVSTLAKLFIDAVSPKVVDSSVAIPPGNGMYLVRGVGPAFVPQQDFDFVNANLPSLYVRAVAINLTSAALDLASAAIDDSVKNVVGSATDIANLSAAALKAAPGIASVEDFKLVAYTICQGLIQDFCKSKMQDAAGAALKAVAKSVASVDQKLQKISSLGQVAERALGLFRTTALETSFIVVGDPFSLQIVSVLPSIASPGQDITVRFLGSPSLQPFDPNNPANLVTFEGNGFFNGLVTAVGGPDANGIQTLTVQIPTSLGTTHDGPYAMYVLSQGRKGSAAFTVSTAAALHRRLPVEWFSADDKFPGKRFCRQFGAAARSGV